MKEKQKQVEQEKAAVLVKKGQTKENKKTIEALKNAEQQADNPEAQAVAKQEIKKMLAANDKMKKKISDAKASEKATIKRAGTQLKAAEKKEAQTEKAEHQALRSVERNQEKEAKALKKIQKHV